MSDTIFRLKKLFSELGINTDGVYANAEIQAYACVIDKIRSNFDEIINHVFVADNLAENYEEYKELMGANVSGTGTDPDMILANRLSGTWKLAMRREYDTVLKNINPALKYSIVDNNFNLIDYDSKGLKKLADFIYGYVPISLNPKLSNQGGNFDSWDQWGKMWCVLDSYKLPFSIIDKLEVNYFE